MREVKDDSDYYQKEKLPFIEMGRTMGGVDFKGEKIRSLVWGILSLRYLLDFEVKMSSRWLAIQIWRQIQTRDIS